MNFTSPRTSSNQASWPYETVQSGTILIPSEGGRKPQREHHQVLAVKGEKHPTGGPELNPQKKTRAPYISCCYCAKSMKYEVEGHKGRGWVGSEMLSP